MDQMSSAEGQRLVKLEAQFEAMNENEDRLQAEIVELKAKIASTSKKIDTAETWGRAVLYCTLAVGGVLSQIQQIATWFKKL